MFYQLSSLHHLNLDTWRISTSHRLVKAVSTTAVISICIDLCFLCTHPLNYLSVLVKNKRLSPHSNRYGSVEV